MFRDDGNSCTLEKIVCYCPVGKDPVTKSICNFGDAMAEVEDIIDSIEDELHASS